MAEPIGERVRELKAVIRQHDGRNVADAPFVRAVDSLIDVFYDDIGEIRYVDIQSLFDLFIMKTLYVNRRSTDYEVLDYLGGMLTRYLFTRELFPIARGEQRMTFYLSDLMEEIRRPTHFQNLFEAYRKYGDNALFLTGVFPRSLGRRRHGGGRLRRAPTPFIDRSYYVTTGKTFYRLAADHELAEYVEQRATLNKLASYFEVYMGALNEASERYILGFDMNLIADKMLDNFNRFRRTGDQTYLENARKYAAILKVDRGTFPSLWQIRRRPRATLL